MATTTTAPAARPPRRRRRVLALGLGFFLALLCAEVGLRIGSPWWLRVRGDRVHLVRNFTIEIPNQRIAGLERSIVHTKNDLGFRGPNPPDDFDERLTVLAVGGSTTECFYLSDGQDWPARMAADLPEALDAWVNNAGLDGHSTRGHRVLLRDYVVKLKPRVVIYMVGLNDVGRSKASGFDDRLESTSASPYTFLARHSMLFALSDAMARSEEAEALGLAHAPVQHTPEALRARIGPATSAAGAAAELERNAPMLAGYRVRLRALLLSTRAAGAQPALVTQAALYGDVVDDVSGVDLGALEIRAGIDGRTAWLVLEAYNQVTRDLGAELDVPVVDVARSLEKSSRHFYDGIHFTAAGAQRVGEIVAHDLQGWLAERAP